MLLHHALWKAIGQLHICSFNINKHHFKHSLCKGQMLEGPRCGVTQSAEGTAH